VPSEPEPRTLNRHQRRIGRNRAQGEPILTTALIAWAIAGTGMYMLARAFQFLAEKRPDIDAGASAACA
jgi:hypothetical protein